MFSKACEYGIKATLYIAQRSQSNESVGLKNISKAIDSPEAFTAKILQELVKQDIISSIKGPGGGYHIEKDKMSEITLIKIVNSIDGDHVYTGCGLGMHTCNEEMPCPAHEKFKPIKESLRIMLETTTIKKMTVGLKGGLTFLK